MTFDLTQTAFLFNGVANAASLTSGLPESLADFVYTGLYGSGKKVIPLVDPMYLQPGVIAKLQTQMVGGDWALTWGPGVYSFTVSTKADNTAFVVYSQSLDTYIVAVAGTDPGAFRDWLLEDLLVGADCCVDWSNITFTGPRPAKGTSTSKADATVPQVSLGTAIGVWALGGNLKLGKAAVNSQYPTLAAYLLSLNPSNTALAKPVSKTTQLIFTGHSLGGALSPTLAAWAKGLSSIGVAPGLPDFPGQIYAMPTAGPTPGNVAYQKAWDAAFPPTGVPPVNAGGVPFGGKNLVTQLNLNVWNLQDVVPHAWTNILSTTSNQTPQIYFYSDGSDTLQTAIGAWKHTLLRDAVTKAAAAGAAGNMAMAANTLPFELDVNGVPNWPIQYYDGEIVESLEEPTGGDAEDKKLLGDLGTIHVSGYGPFAFGIPFSVYQTIHPTKITVPTATS